MTLDDFQATVRARFPTLTFEFSEVTRLASVSYYARHERCAIECYQGKGPFAPEWQFAVGEATFDEGDTLAAAIDAHQLRLQLITTHAAAIGLDDRSRWTTFALQAFDAVVKEDIAAMTPEERDAAMGKLKAEIRRRLNALKGRP